MQLDSSQKELYFQDMLISLILIDVGKTCLIAKPFIKNQIHKLEMVQKLLLYSCAKGFGQIQLLSWFIGSKAYSMIFCRF